MAQVHRRHCKAMLRLQNALHVTTTGGWEPLWHEDPQFCLQGFKQESDGGTFFFREIAQDGGDEWKLSVKLETEKNCFTTNTFEHVNKEEQETFFQFIGPMVSFIDCTQSSENAVLLDKGEIESSANWCLIEISTKNTLFDAKNNIMPNLGVSLNEYFIVQNTLSTLKYDADA